MPTKGRFRPKTKEVFKNGKHKVVHYTHDDIVTFRSVRGHEDIFSMREEAIWAAIDMLWHYGRNMMLSEEQLKKVKHIAKNSEVFDLAKAHANIEKKP